MALLFIYCSLLRCKAWNDAASVASHFYRKLAVRCDGSTGEWKAEEDTGSESMSLEMISGKSFQACAAAVLFSVSKSRFYLFRNLNAVLLVKTVRNSP